MRYSIPVKFIAILLTAIAMVVAFAGALGIVQVAELGLYTDGLDSWMQNRLEWQAYGLAEDLTDRYAVRSLTNCPDDVLEELGYWYVFEESIHWTGLDEESYDFTITAPSGDTLAAATGLPADETTGFFYQTVCSIQYPVLVTDETVIEEIYGQEYLYQQTKYLSAYDDKPVTIRYYESPEYTVVINLDPDAALGRAGTSLELVEMIYENRYNLMIVLAVALTVFAMGLVYLCCAAGRSRAGAEVSPTGLNRMALDLYLAAGGAAGYVLVVLAAQMINYWIFGVEELNPGTLALVGIVLLGIALIFVGFVFALSAQLKMKNLFWWKHSIIGWLCGKIWIGIRLTARGIMKFAGMLPVIWRYLLIGAAMGILPLFFFYLAAVGESYWVFFLFMACICDVIIICYGGYAYGVLLRGAGKMAKGDLDSKIDKRFLVGSYARCADHLNALADVAVVAAKNQMKSDRMKTELITNVSHDIKTPLTSIINYVDLLQKAETAEQSVQYLEVLGRQSQRLKKLIDDLMEMSKATTGNMSVDITRVDPVEAVNQALGEFSDKLNTQNLTVIFRQPEVQLAMRADGRLTWRVLSNLLSNIVKYALPGTRVYVDVLQLESKVLISLKNISREELNVTADELTDRFVRGDASRNTEGSGLGLNIAKSLMELQKGQLQLLVDGDLFKVTLVFPTA